jgi:hypothetical protein
MTTSDASVARASEVPARRAETSSTFRPSHFFVLASLMAATAAVIMSRQSTPEHLVLISLTIASAGLAAAGFYRMLSPLVVAGSAAASEALSDRARAVLTREKALVLRALKDLEFDRSMGKVSQTDFEEMAGRLRARAISLMKQIDDDGSGYRTIIERELSARLAARAAGGAAEPAPEAADEEQPAHALEPDSPGRCACGTVNDLDAVFCKHCGTRVSRSGASTPPR